MGVGCSDDHDFGNDWTSHRVPVRNARGAGLRLDRNGVELVHDPVEEQDFDYLDDAAVQERYYPRCCELVRAVTGAKDVMAFDHNVRSRELRDAGAHMVGGSAAAVLGPATIVHNDYTITSAPRRLEQLGGPSPHLNDTVQQQAAVAAAVGSAAAQGAQRRRRTRAARARSGQWCMVNVWRNIKAEPVARTPLAVVDASSVPLDGESVVTFEIRYQDRVGENYVREPATGRPLASLPTHAADRRALYLLCRLDPPKN
eukprot:COSAG01_NODE_58_length_30193_cov_12.302020_22_plen_257_part_00